MSKKTYRIIGGVTLLVCLVGYLCFYHLNKPNYWPKIPPFSKDKKVVSITVEGTTIKSPKEIEKIVAVLKKNEYIDLDRDRGHHVDYSMLITYADAPRENICFTQKV